ncbi:sensor histidine kinase [Actinomadura sp. HBU206391]|uniref:sensor histidine kinase n=1 Tax=Actinomadura sp. HBU206391 TaxID=2731692 RepID=UPI00164F0985|nr:ATP-binding protein [Actinomadura sp. HBU206391]MBC6461821.1 ATP-binding protein [Actinomadura sp. HBU206391]
MTTHLHIRRQAERPPIDRALLGPLAAVVVVAGGVCLWATAAAPATQRAIVALSTGSAAILFCLAVAAAAYGLSAVRHLRARIAVMETGIARLADETFPAVVGQLRDGLPADTVLAEVPQPADATQQRILRTLAQEIGKGERMRAAAMSACANAAGRVQALATSMLADLREMENRYDEDVLGDLLKLDHSTAQAGRLADSIAVLTGARSGRRWTKPIVMESILRGAVGRISAYQRVRIHSTSNVAIAGYAAEGIMHALAELMDNATSFSAPSEQVHVYVEEVHAGVVVTIEDGGLVMSATALNRAERAVSAEPLDLTTLSGTRLGLAVVGCLARKHGLTVSFRPSSRGGTGVVVMIPRQLITQVGRDPASATARSVGAQSPSAAGRAVTTPAEADTSPQPIVSVEAAEAPASREAAGPEAAQPEAGEASGLPKRPRGRTLAAASRDAGARQPKRTQPPTDAGARFSAFRQAGRGGGGTGGDASAAPHDDVR